MANVTLELRLVRVTGGVTTVVGKVRSGQVFLSGHESETPGAGDHVYKLQAHDSTSLYVGQVYGRTLTAIQAKR